MSHRASGEDAERDTPMPAPAPTKTAATPTRAPDLASRGADGPMLVQTKLLVGSSADPAEQEADQVARRVEDTLRTGYRRPVPEYLPGVDSRISRSAATGGGRAHAGGAGRTPTGRVRRATAGGKMHRAVETARMGPEGGTLSGHVATRIEELQGRGSALRPEVRRSMESAFGADFGDVRVHAGSESAMLNKQLGARAFTAGQDVFFRDGMPDTGSTDGKNLLAHELTHTLQQGGVRRMVIRRDDKELPTGFTPDFTGQTGELTSGHEKANKGLEGVQGGTSSIGEFDSANNYRQGLADSHGTHADATSGKQVNNEQATGKAGPTDQVQADITGAAAGMATFDLVVDISKTIQVFMSNESTKMDKAQAVLGTAGTGGKAAAGIASAVKAGQNADTGSATDIGAKVTAEIGGFLTVFSSGYKIVKQIYELASKEPDDKMSDQEKASAGVEMVKNILELAKGIVEQIGNFMSHLGTVAAGVLSAAPAIGIAINTMDMIMNGINIGYSWVSWKEMRTDKRASKEALLGAPAAKSKGIRGVFGGHESAEGAAKGAITKGEDLSKTTQQMNTDLSQASEELTGKKDLVKKSKVDLQAAKDRIEELENLPKRSKKEATELAKLKKSLPRLEKKVEDAREERRGARQTRDTKKGLAEKAGQDEAAHAGTHTTAKDYLLSKRLQMITGKRIKRGLLNVGLTLPAIAGDIAMLSGAGAAVGAGLKVGSGAGKLAAVGVRGLKQAYHDKVGDDKSEANKLKLYDEIIKGITDHVIRANAGNDPGEKKKVVNEIVASGMTIPTMKRLAGNGPELYKEWLKALKKR